MLELQKIGVIVNNKLNKNLEVIYFMKINDTNTTVKIGQCYNCDIITIDNDGIFKCGDAVVHSVKVNTAKPKVYVTSKP